MSRDLLTHLVKERGFKPTTNLLYQLCEQHSFSLVPRLPHSGTQTLMMCRHGEPGIFPHMSTIKGRKWVAIERLNCAWAYPRLGTEKTTTKVAGNLLHVSIAIGGRISYTPSVERIVD